MVPTGKDEVVRHQNGHHEDYGKVPTGKDEVVLQQSRHHEDYDKVPTGKDKVDRHQSRHHEDYGKVSTGKDGVTIVKLGTRRSLAKPDRQRNKVVGQLGGVCLKSHYF